MLLPLQPSPSFTKRRSSASPLSFRLPHSLSLVGIEHQMRNVRQIVLAWGRLLSISAAQMGVEHQIRLCVPVLAQHLGDVDLLLLLPDRLPGGGDDLLGLGLGRAGIHPVVQGLGSFGEERPRGLQDFGLAGELETLGGSPFACFVAQP